MQNWTYHGPFFSGNVEKYPKTGDVWELPVFLPLGLIFCFDDLVCFLFIASLEAGALSGFRINAIKSAPSIATTD